MLVSCLASSSTLKVEAIFSSEMSIDFHCTARPYMPEHKTVEDNLKVLPVHDLKSNLRRLQNSYGILFNFCHITRV
jgi:hypothetical protein